LQWIALIVGYSGLTWGNFRITDVTLPGGWHLWQTKGAMLIELWEKFCEYDKWVPAVATVQSTELSRVGEIGHDKSKPPVALGWESNCRIKWQDKNQTERSAVFQAYEESPLYQLIEGDTVGIRFNPANPSEYYLPGLMQSRVLRTWKLAIYITMLIVLVIALLVFTFAH
jgi:hypothetical protein